MHVPDGFLDLPTSIATGAIAAGAVALAVRKSTQELRESGVPLAGLTAVFVFAAQMVNFPVAVGASGHLLGGALAAVLVGPWTAVLCMSVVLGVQALFFADGGLTALGTNILLMAVVTPLVGYYTARGVLFTRPRRPGSAVSAAPVGAFVSVLAAALSFVGLYALGGVVPLPIGTLTMAMLGWHAVIGLGEALITGAVVATVVASRPDLVHLVRHLRPTLVHVGPDGRRRPVTASALAAPARPGRAWVGTAAALCLIVAGGLSLVASASPDGLEHVAATLGFDSAARDSASAGSPLADYTVAGLGTWSTPLAGILGVLVVALGAWALFAVVRRVGPQAGVDPAVESR
ncbi:MAG: energy-coupling factor ABC transporter permease [Actinomycetales bacterium]